MSDNKNKRAKVSEEDVFKKLNNFPKQMEERKKEIDAALKDEQRLNWEETLVKLDFEMSEALKHCSRDFYVIVDSLNEVQRDALCEKINKIPNMKATWDSKSFRDSKERYVMDVEITK